MTIPDINFHDVYYGLIGGLFIGLSVVGLMLTLGRIGGISGIIQASMWSEEKVWRRFFLIGLMVTVSVFHYYFPYHVAARENFPFGWLGISGLLVGVGVALGNGCTSGHGICGISRFSRRSIVATLLFFGSALITRYFIHTKFGLVP